MTVTRLFTVLLLLVSFRVFAQDPKPADLPGWKLKNYTNGYERIGDTYAAIEMAEEYVNRYPKRQKMKKTLARLYMNARDYKSSFEMYSQVFEKTEGKDPLIHFNYAMMAKKSGNYGRAEALFSSFLSYYKKDKKTAAYYDLVENELKGTQFASGQVADTNMIIVHLDSNVNRAHIDFSPFPINDSTLLYASLKADDASFESTEEIPKRRFYMAHRLDSGSYKNIPLKFNFNDPEFDCGNGTLSEDGKMFIFSKCAKNTPTAKGQCKLFMSTFSKDKWTEPVELPSPINGPDFTSSYPAFGMDSKKSLVLYYSSNRPDGKGGMDIWYSVYDEKKKIFKSSKNCGKEINSVRDDITPYYNSTTKKFYYSTEGHEGFGGLDIYQTEGELKRWNESKNMGSPINSPADDLYYIQRKDNESGYLVSNREGGVALENATCCDDIYEFVQKKPVDIYVVGTVQEVLDPSQPVLPPAPGSVGLYLDIDNKLVLVNQVELPLTNDFAFKLSQNTKYKLITEKAGYFKTSQKIDTKGMKNSDTIRVDPSIRQIPYAPIVVKNIYYPFDKDYLTASSKEIIDTTIFKIMSDNPEIIVEIGSHTDGLGTDEYNNDLSQRRAQSVVNYLITKGITENRLSAKGYGKSQPIAPNQNEDGSDNPDGRQKNRRTEFRVTGILPGVSDIIYEE